MIKFELQFFGGRGGSGVRNSKATARTKSKTKVRVGSLISQRDISKLSEGSVIEVQNFSAITGQPLKTTTKLTLEASGRWTGRGGISIDNSSQGFSVLNSKNGVVPKIKLRKRG